MIRKYVLMPYKFVTQQRVHVKIVGAKPFRTSIFC